MGSASYSISSILLLKLSSCLKKEKKEGIFKINTCLIEFILCYVYI